MRLFSYAWRGRRAITLRVRAALLCCALFALFYGVIIIAAYRYQTDMSRRVTDQALLAAAESVAASAVKQRAKGADMASLELPDARLARVRFLVIRDRNAVPLFQSGNRSGYDRGVRAAMIGAARGADRTLTTIPSDESNSGDRGSAVRIATVPVIAPAGERYYVQAGVVPGDLSPVSRTMLDLLYFTFPGALVAAFCTGWVLAGYVIEPLKAVGTTAERVTVDQLNARIPMNPNESSEIAEVKSKLNAALERLQRGYEAHDRFISNVAHDLRTPIATILTESQVIRMTPGTKSDEYHRFANSVEDEMRRLGRLIESFLMLARAEHGAPITLGVDVPLNDVALEAVRHSTPIARLYHISIHTTLDETTPELEELTVRGDPDLLRTMIENLLQNALKFSPRGAAIEVRVASRTGEAVIEVRDRGPGIPQDLADSLFHRFTQAPDEAPRFRGAGLGLAIARSVAVIHHGRISAHNRADGGCVFEVYLPLATSDEPEPSPQPISGVAPTGEPSVLTPAG